MTEFLIEQTRLGHLTPAIWNQASNHLLAKIISEFSHEKLITPDLVRQADITGQAEWQLKLGIPMVSFVTALQPNIINWITYKYSLSLLSVLKTESTSYRTPCH
ncbi:hypothetical protein ACT691_19005 [Vibrio metschnikovii]